jgi:hypothetical protein
MQTERLSPSSIAPFVPASTSPGRGDADAVAFKCSSSNPQISSSQGAAWLVSVLERRGAVFHLQPDGYVLCDLNPSDVASFEEAERLS